MPSTSWPQPNSESLERARRGDPDAVGQVLLTYRDQLKRVVNSRLDTRLRSRMDESDVVNDVLAVACESLPAWLSDEKPLYACLHRLVRNRLSAIYRDQVVAQKRSVEKETPLGISNESMLQLCRRLGARGDTPSRDAVQREMQQRLRRELDALPELDREVIVLRTLEGTPAREVAAVLGVTESAIRMRHLRALERLRTAMAESDS